MVAYKPTLTTSSWYTAVNSLHTLDKTIKCDFTLRGLKTEESVPLYYRIVGRWMLTEVSEAPFAQIH